MIKDNAEKIKLRVKINDKVLRGQPLIFGDSSSIVPIHSPTSGYIEKISYNLNYINKKKRNITITIVSDYLDKWIRLKPIQNYKKYSPDKLIQIIYQSGIVGLGGGQFSSAKKLILSMNKVHTLIVNAVESEPFITSDNFLIINHIYEILQGCEIISWISKVKIVLIAIQEDRIQSIEKIYNFIKNKSLFRICILKKKYPGGSSKVLIKSLTGKEIPYNQHAIDIGYLVFNVATIYAIKRAIINGEPLTERILTFLGDQNSFFGNIWTRIGTPLKFFLKDKKIENFFNTEVYLGGPFMGKRIFDINYSVLKKTNCISIQTDKKKHLNIIEYSCIRCSNCSSICPVNLLPQQLYWYSKNNNNHKQTKDHHILDCIECKACEKVCPSYIPLVKYFKKEKDILKSIESEKYRKKLSLIRFKIREKRLLNEKKIISTKQVNNYANFFERNDLNHKEKKDVETNYTEKNKRKKILQEAIKRMKSKKRF